MKLLLPIVMGTVLGIQAMAAPVTLSSNLSQLTQPGLGLPDPVTSTTWTAAAFRTDGLSYSTILVEVALETTNPWATLFLYSDAGNKPGVAVSAVPLLSILSGPNIHRYWTAASLAPNTEYWVVLQGPASPAPNASWYWTTSNAGSGPGFLSTWARTPDSGVTWSVSNASPMIFAVTADIPEPASTGLMLIGLWFLFIWKARQRP